MAYEEKTEFDASKGSEVRLTCTECDNKTKHVVISSVDTTQDVNDGEILGWTTYQIVRCLGCETLGFRKNHSNTEDFYIDGEEMVLIEDEEVYPPRLAGRPKLRNDDLLPFDVKHIYGEAHKALVSEMPVLTAVGVRALIETICIEEEAEGNNLKEKVENLVALGVLTSPGAEILQKLRLLGNEAAHEMKRHNLVKLGTAFDVVENLLETVYVIPAKAERLD